MRPRPPCKNLVSCVSTRRVNEGSGYPLPTCTVTTVLDCKAETFKHRTHQQRQPDRSRRDCRPQLHTDRLSIPRLDCLVPIKSVDGIDGTVVSTDHWMFLNERKTDCHSSLPCSVSNIFSCSYLAPLPHPPLLQYFPFRGLLHHICHAQYLTYRFISSDISVTLRLCLSLGNLSLSRNQLYCVGKDGWLDG